MGYKHLIFDIDGTLVDNEKVVIATWQETILQLFGKHYETSDLNFVLGIPGVTTMERLGAENPQEAFVVWGQNFIKHKAEIELFPHIEHTIAALKSKGLDLGLVTSRTHDELNNDFALGEIIGNFDTIICVTDAPRPKPNPDPLLVYMERCGLSPDEVLYIGDSDYDYHCAKNAKVDFGVASWGDNRIRHTDARFSFNSPMDILNI
ncbi:MAG: HAD family hydrolase [Parabacteroides sp.]|nr:HAD family hydrolase [Parabacteroides sp.]